jgi:hypothetical protein
MAGVVLIRSPLVLGPGAGLSQNLASAALDPVSTRPLHVVGQRAGTRQALADPRPAAMQHSGGIAQSAGLSVHGLIHVIPRKYDFGAVVSQQDLEIEVWNADLKRAHILEEVTVSGALGIEVTPPAALPIHFPGSGAHLFQVNALSQGDAVINNLVAFVFLAVQEDTDLQLTGFRLIPFTFPPDWTGPVTEQIGYLTDIITSFRGMEQRIQLRDIPNGTLTYTSLLATLRDLQTAGAILFGNQARAFGVGRWQFAATPTAPAPAGSQDLVFDTANLPLAAGGLVLLWMSPYQWEVGTIETVWSDRITLQLALQYSWPAQQATVLPLLIGYLSQQETLSWASLATGHTNLTFAIDRFTP